ncbi:MAG: acetyl-CoA C-acyltransferase [Methylococcales bacterium]
MNETPIIIAAKRTPLGSFQGQFSSLKAAELGAPVIRSLIESTNIEADEIDELHFGCVLPAGQGQAPARQAALDGGLPLSVPCNTVNKMCGSGMQTVMYACNQILAGDANIVIAGGMESMTNAPYLLPQARGGYRIGNGEIIDHMFFDGLQDVKKGQLMGTFAELCAEKYALSREVQDDFAIRSLERARAATESNAFADEIVPVMVKSRKGETTFDLDEQPQLSNINKIKTLRSAFKKDGTVTAANSSSISDGASAMLLMSAAEAEKRDLKPLARIIGQVTHAQDPDWFTTAPIYAIEKLLKKINWQINDVDLYEINEAFAVVTMVAINELGLDPDKVNVNGGACALGHPIGASGTRILTTLVHALKKRGLKKGIASLCIGGGEATAMAIEIID